MDISEGRKKVQDILERQGTRLRQKLQEHFVQSKIKETIKQGGLKIGAAAATDKPTTT